MALFRTQSDNEIWVGPSPSVVGPMVAYFDRVNDIDQIRDAIIQRYGTGIRITKDPNSGVQLETYVQEGFAERVYTGAIEAISVGYGMKVASALATLFAAQTARFSLSREEAAGGEADGEALEKTTKYLNKHRRQGRFGASLVRADMLSVEVGCSVILVEYATGHLKYSAYDPGALQVLYYREVLEDDRPRAARLDDLDDAVGIILRTGSVNGVENSYLGIFGASERYPDGRYCSFNAITSEANSVPEPGTDGCYDFRMDDSGELANPWVLYGRDHQDQQIPEYPICIIYGGQTLGSLLPVSQSLYRASLDMDVAASHTRSTSQDAARGSNVITRDIKAAVAKLPRSLVGNVDLAPGLTFEHVALGAEESQIAWEVASKQSTAGASSWSVPDYMVAQNENKLSAEASGVNLEIKTRPLNKATALRRDLNAPSVDRLFLLEKSLLDMYSDSDADVAVLMGCEQVWDFLEVKIPVDPIQNSARIIGLMDKGVMDTIEAIRQEYGYDSDEDAIAQYERMKERKTTYPALVEPPKPPGLPGASGPKGGTDDDQDRRDDPDRSGG